MKFARLGAMTAIAVILLTLGAMPARGFDTEVLGVIHLPIHQDITRKSLSFLKPAVLEDNRG